MKLKQIATTLLELAGFGAVVAGVWLIWWIAGLIALGIALFAVGALNG